jgi:hypothetical protein
MEQVRSVPKAKLALEMVLIQCYNKDYFEGKCKNREQFSTQEYRRAYALPS